MPPQKVKISNIKAWKGHFKGIWHMKYLMEKSAKVKIQRKARGHLQGYLTCEINDKENGAARKFRFPTEFLKKHFSGI